MTQPMGGTELMKAGIYSRLPQDLLSSVNIIVGNTDPAELDTSRPNLLWQHHNWDQPLVANIADPNFLEKINCLVFVSNWQFEQYRKNFGVPAYKSVVIPNATDAAVYRPRSNQIKRLIYTSTPWRGLHILLDALDLLKDHPLELHVFSSTQIYGQQFFEQNDYKFAHLWERCKSDSRITLHGYQSNQVIKSYLSEADIFSYPCCWEETFCIAALEALMCGCQVVTTGLGALPELCGPWASMVTYGEHHPTLALRYAHVLLDALRAPSYDGSDQSSYYNRFYTWDQILPKWIQLLQKLKENSTND